MDCYIGEIRLFSFTNIPGGWLLCDGRQLEIQKYPQLFSLIGNQFGGDGHRTFNLPDMGGRTLMGESDEYPVRHVGGSESVVLTTDQIPSHTHKIHASTSNGTLASPVQNVFATPTTIGKRYSDTANQVNTVMIAPIGGGQGHDNMMPYVAMQYCIAYRGVFPS